MFKKVSLFYDAGCIFGGLVMSEVILPIFCFISWNSIAINFLKPWKSF